jgi:hypothetical protein
VSVRTHITCIDCAIISDGAVITQFLTDGVTEGWIDFTYRGSDFSVNDQFGSYWFLLGIRIFRMKISKLFCCTVRQCLPELGDDS